MNAKWVDVAKLAADIRHSADKHGNTLAHVWANRIEQGDFDAPEPPAAGLDRGKVVDDMRDWLSQLKGGGTVESESKRYVLLTLFDRVRDGVYDIAPAPQPPPAEEGDAIPAAIPAAVAPFLRAYIRETKRPDCLPEYRFQVTLPRGRTVWHGNMTEAVQAILDAVNGEKGEKGGPA